MGIFSDLRFKANPFEHYAAETEPDIAEYAVRPPYLNSIAESAMARRSFLLLGDRGSGKSATRITVYSEIWKIEKEAKPLIVNLTDFSAVLEKFSKGQLSDLDLVRLAAYAVLEQTLGWLSSLEEHDRTIYINGLDQDERSLATALLEEFYFSVPEGDRERSISDALKLLNAAWRTHSAVWVNRRWDALSRIVATITSSWTNRKLDVDTDITETVERVLRSLRADGATTPRVILDRLVQFVQALGFSGVCVLVDKVDETPATSRSAEATAKLIHPILNHVQLLEVKGFSWLFFLWSNVQHHFQEKLSVRLDKIAHANITWTDSALREMIERRLNYFSQDGRGLKDILDESLDANTLFEELCRLTSRSPREIIKALDTIVREHDALGSEGLIGRGAIDQGLDKYARETVGIWYPHKQLQQVLRLGMTSFVNKDVQGKFKIGDQGARTKINGWQESGLVKQEGTAPSELGSKPVYRYVISDPKTARIIERQLDDAVGGDAIIDDEGELTPATS